MEKGDIYTLIIGFIFIIIVAILVKPGALSSILPQPVSPAVQPAITTVPVPTTPITPSVTVPNGSIVVLPAVPADRIFYSSTPFSHPVVHLPDNMGIFGVSDIPWRDQDLIPFAFLEESRGGITQNFSVPYEVWMLNITVISTRQPQYAKFRMALCDSRNGAFLEGVEILNYGTMYKIVQVSNIDMYMIISAENVDSFRITLETPRNYYDKKRSDK